MPYGDVGVDRTDVIVAPHRNSVSRQRPLGLAGQREGVAARAARAGRPGDDFEHDVKVLRMARERALDHNVLHAARDHPERGLVAEHPAAVRRGPNRPADVAAELAERVPRREGRRRPAAGPPRRDSEIVRVAARAWNAGCNAPPTKRL